MVRCSNYLFYWLPRGMLFQSDGKNIIKSMHFSSKCFWPYLCLGTVLCALIHGKMAPLKRDLKSLWWFWTCSVFPAERCIFNWTQGWISRIVEDVLLIVGKGTFTSQPCEQLGEKIKFYREANKQITNKTANLIAISRMGNNISKLESCHKHCLFRITREQGYRIQERKLMQLLI